MLYCQNEHNPSREWTGGQLVLDLSIIQHSISDVPATSATGGKSFRELLVTVDSIPNSSLLYDRLENTQNNDRTLLLETTDAYLTVGILDFIEPFASWHRKVSCIMR